MKFFERMFTRVLRPTHAGFNAREAEVHEEHEHAGDQDPHRVGTDLELRCQFRHWIGSRLDSSCLRRLCRSRGLFFRRLLRIGWLGSDSQDQRSRYCDTAVARAFLDRIQLVVPFVNLPFPEG